MSVPSAAIFSARFVVADRPQRLHPRGSVPLTEEEQAKVRASMVLLLALLPVAAVGAVG